VRTFAENNVNTRRTTRLPIWKKPFVRCRSFLSTDPI